MSYLDDLQAAIAAHPDVADYRITLNERRGVSIGIKDNQVGNVYNPFTFSAVTSGSFLIQWRDGRLSRGSLDGSSLEQIGPILEVARQAAYEDPDAAVFLGPQRVTTVPLFSTETASLIDERPGDLLHVIELLQQQARRIGSTILSGSVGASISRRMVRTSRGLNLVEDTTSFGYSYYFDGILGDGFLSRAPVSLEEIEQQTQRTGAFFAALKRPGRSGMSGQLQLILHPNVAYQLVDFFILGNLQGSLVYHGQSAFSRAAFQEGQRVLREDLTLAVDPLVQMGPGSYAFTGEGVPAAPATYIGRGRLEQPILDLKYARKMGLPPSSPPSNAYTVNFFSQRHMPDWEEFLPQIDEAILVLSLLGLNTQERSSGMFSLTGPQALYIRDGAVIGHSKATFRGSFFEALRSEELQLIRFAGQHSPGLSMQAHVTLEQRDEV
ncbi:MAG: peptidase [Herpetosiphonaceae bacterium]|nr:MAG: peptidase [Herpetosiphonaceae bacterium]